MQSEAVVKGLNLVRVNTYWNWEEVTEQVIGRNAGLVAPECLSQGWTQKSKESSQYLLN